MHHARIQNNATCEKFSSFCYKRALSDIVTNRKPKQFPTSVQKQEYRLLHSYTQQYRVLAFQARNTI